MKITVLNMKTLQEYRIHHDRTLEDTDIVITYNGHNHFNAAGEKFRCIWTLLWMTQLLHRNHWQPPERPLCRSMSVYIAGPNVHLNAPLNDPQFFYCKYEGPSKWPTCYIFSESWPKLVEVCVGVFGAEGVPLEILHPSDTEDKWSVGLTSEDEAEGLEPTPGVSRHSFGGPPAPVAQLNWFQHNPK